MNGMTFADLLNVLSLFIEIQNLEMNLTQDDKQDLQNDLSKNADRLLSEIHGHLEQQDLKIDSILKMLEGENENNLKAD